MDIDHSCDFSESAVEHEDIPPDPALQEICGSEVNTEFSKEMSEVKTLINIYLFFFLSFLMLKQGKCNCQ